MQRKYLYIGILAVIVIVALVLAYEGTGGGVPGSGLVAFDNQSVPQSIISQLHVSGSVSSNVGIGLASASPAKIVGPELTLNGKPVIIYIGAEFCPYCAMERWGLVIALLRFGNFSGLEYMTSSATDIGPNTPTFTFVNSTYNSPYLVFQPYELADKLGNPLQTAPKEYMAIFLKAGGGYPFTDYANESEQIGTNLANPGDLNIVSNMNWSTIANKLQNSSSLQSMALVGSANLITAQICKITNDTPQSVCGQNYIKRIESGLS